MTFLARTNGELDLSIEIENVRKDVRMRIETDSIMSIAWILSYLLPIILGIVGSSIIIIVIIWLAYIRSGML
jgi:hypothetical protein